MFVFYDFEVFAHDWLVVLVSPDEGYRKTIVNDRDELARFFDANCRKIWVGFNSRHYDVYILKAVLLGMDPKKVNDFIIRDGNDGWRYSEAFRDITVLNYDVMQNTDRGLKYFEGSLGSDIRETSVPFDIDRKLTQEEVAETARYCTHDVEQTIEVFLQRKADFEAMTTLIRMFELPIECISKTKVQLAATILEAARCTYHDEFDISIPGNLRIDRYRHVVDWYRNQENRDYSRKLDTVVAGVPHSFGWGGVHGAIPCYSGSGWYVNMDVASLYPNIMLNYGLLSRSCNPLRFKYIVDTRLRYKAEGKDDPTKNAIQKALKIVINGTYGASKDQYNSLYDPRQANNVCVYGQLLLLDLIEHLEGHCQVIQSNTDGVLVRLPDGSQEAYDAVDDIAWEWEQRTGLRLEFENYVKVVQKDVNNYVMVGEDGHLKVKGAYVQKPTALSYDLAVVNRAVVEQLVHDVPPAQTIAACDTLKDFQLTKKISSKYEGLYLGEKRLQERCVRAFATKDQKAPGLWKRYLKDGKLKKVEGTPEHCRLVNGNVNGASVPEWLDKDWYVRLAEKRAGDFTDRRNKE